MSASTLRAALERRNAGRPPVWFMRQAGRYHSHYQQLKARHSFLELCRDPGLAAEVALGPVEDFGFDAAILFSDLLFPLEAMGMPLDYVPGPKLGWHLRSRHDVTRLASDSRCIEALDFQAEALRVTRARLAPEKGLLGFAVGPLTLFFYATSGSHHGELTAAHAGLADGTFEAFCARLTPLLSANIVAQARAGADVVALLDTCAGEVSPRVFGTQVVPALERLLTACHGLGLEQPLLYYSRGTSPAHWDQLGGLGFAGLGIDWRHRLSDVLPRYGTDWAIQGNFDPHLLLEQDPAILEPRLHEFFADAAALPGALRRGWICGLGHGVLPGTPERNVRRFLALQKEYFA
ncbi:MAG: uroporphyrinogen decarboxylase [Gammaproteobacteria bacterium]|nr:uroporphyrinogen decarboxylase [Gammaproteobacteria bacterium]